MLNYTPGLTVKQFFLVWNSSGKIKKKKKKEKMSVWVSDIDVTSSSPEAESQSAAEWMDYF